MPADTALVEELLRTRYSYSALDIPANVLIFPAGVVGPVLVGMARPVHVLQRGSETADVAAEEPMTMKIV